MKTTKSTYMTSAKRHKLLNHIAALKALRKEISDNEENLIRIAYKQRVTNRDLGKIYKALNSLAAISATAEMGACHATLNAFKLRIEK